jgi:hypothetical protein
LWDYWTTTTRIERKDRLLGILMTGSEWIQKWVVDLDSRKKSIENGWKLDRWYPQRGKNLKQTNKSPREK